MCDGMRLDKRLIVLGVVIIVLSMTMATQYATTRVTYSFAIVHPSEADIRYIGSDNSSDDNQRVLRVNNNASGSMYATMELGDWMPDSQKNYTAAFGIVNEEQFAVNITYVNVSGTGSANLTIWLHGDRDEDYTGEAADQVKVVNAGSALYGASDVVWTLAAGNNDTTDMADDAGQAGSSISTLWDDTSHVKYSVNDANDSANETSDFVWVGVSLDIPSDSPTGTPTGTIYIHFKASTQT